MDRLRLTRAQRRGLERQLHQAQDARVYKRTFALLECSRGRSVADVAASIGVSRRSIYSWIESYNQDRNPSAMADAPRSGRPRLWSPEREALLLALLETSPDRLGYFAVNWTVPLLREQIEEQTGLRLSEDTIRRELQRQRYVWKRYRYVLDPDPDLEKKTQNKAADPQFELGHSCSDRG